MAAAKHSAEDFIAKVRQLRADGASDELIATTIGVHGRKLYERLARLGYKLADFPKGEGPKASRVRSANMSYDQLKADRKRTYHRKRVHENDLAQLTITLPGDGPYGIVFLGDPHVDDDGCDWGALDRHIGIIRDTDGLYAVNLGDTTNNWIGRLERLYAHQRTTSAEARILAAGFIQELAGKWLFHIGGNHDLWSGSDDPLPAICEAAKATYIPIGGKITVRQGRHLLHLNARHTFPGNSMWNPAHGAGRSVMMGNIEHITVCGHKHTTGHMVIKAPNQRICHALQVASYKLIDSYAKEGGFRDNCVSPACMVVVDPRYADTDPAMLTVFHSVERGADYLRSLRTSHAAEAKKAARRRAA